MPGASRAQDRRTQWPTGHPNACLEHDPEKWVPVFPRDKREAFARRSCSNKKIERDDDSKKSHPALAPCPQDVRARTDGDTLLQGSVETVGEFDKTESALLQRSI